MDKEQAVKKALEYAKVVNKSLDTQKIVLYGSYAKDNWKEESDIDIAVIVERVEGDFLDLSTMLWKLRRAIDSRIEPVLIEEDSDRSGFVEEILKHGQIIYSA